MAIMSTGKTNWLILIDTITNARQVTYHARKKAVKVNNNHLEAVDTKVLRMFMSIKDLSDQEDNYIKSAITKKASPGVKYLVKNITQQRRIMKS